MINYLNKLCILGNMKKIGVWLFAFILPIPFLGLELLVGFVQAAIFSILTLVFMVILTEKHSLGGEH